MAAFVVALLAPATSDARIDPRPNPTPSIPQPHFFETNGAALDEEAFPLQIVTVGEAPGGISTETWGTIVEASVDEWSQVTCSFAMLTFAGHRNSKEEIAEDEIPIVASATSTCVPEDFVAWTTFTPCGGYPSRTILMNTADFEWTVEPQPFQMFDSEGRARIIDVESTITHELGHVLGLSHPEDPLATMHASYRPDGSMRTLALDDKLGMCSLYPVDSPTPECTQARPCPDEETCVEADEYQLCKEFRGSVGEQCGLDHLVCEQRCALEDEQSGYCTATCEASDDCPEGYNCVDGFLEGAAGAYCAKIDPEEPPRGCCSTGVTRTPERRAPVFLVLMGLMIVARRRWPAHESRA